MVNYVCTALELQLTKDFWKHTQEAELEQH